VRSPNPNGSNDLAPDDHPVEHLPHAPLATLRTSLVGEHVLRRLFALRERLFSLTDAPGRQLGHHQVGQRQHAPVAGFCCFVDARRQWAKRGTRRKATADTNGLTPRVRLRPSALRQVVSVPRSNRTRSAVPVRSTAPAPGTCRGFSTLTSRPTYNDHEVRPLRVVDRGHQLPLPVDEPIADAIAGVCAPFPVSTHWAA
jgi:hypothetical protein